MSEFECEPCADDGKRFDAFGFCLDCCEYLCEECYLYHRKPRQTRNHALLDKEQMIQQKESLPTKDAIKDDCPQHSEEIVKYFCQTHDTQGCAVCITTDHRLCEDVVHIPQVSKGIADSEEYQELEAQIDETTKRLEAIIPAATANIAKSEASNTKVVNAMDEFKGDIFSTINRLAGYARVEAEQCKDTDTQKMNAIILKARVGLKKMHVMKAGIKNLKKLGRENKLFLAVKTSKKDAEKVQEELTELESDNTVRICRFESNAQLRKFLRSLERLGGLSDTADDASDFIDSSSSEDAEQTGTVPIEAIKADYLGDDRCIYIKPGNEHLCSVTAIAMFDQNKMVAVTCSVSYDTVGLKQIRVYNRRVQVIDTIRNRILSELVLHYECSGMVKISEGYAALNLVPKGEASFYEKEGPVLYRVGKTLVADKQLYSSGRNLQLSSFDNNLYICDSNKVVKVDMNGHTTDVVVSQEVNRECQIFKACALYENRSETHMYAIVTEYKSDRSSTYLGHGPINKKITDKVDLPAEPKYIVMSDDRKLLFVVTRENDNDVIYVLRTGATDAYVLLSKEDGLKYVAAICYCSKKKQLFIAAPSCNFVKIYQLSGLV